MNNKVYQMVTDRIIEQMQKGIIPWKKPWKGAKVSGEDYAINYTTRRAYSRLNQWLLWEPGEYLTYKQIQELGGKIRKGAKAKFVVFYTKAEYKTTDPKTGEEKTVSYPLLRYYNVFHLKDTEGIPTKIVPGEKVEVESDTEADAIIDAYVTRECIKFSNNKPSDQAYYSPSRDEVVVPMKSQYTRPSEYYSTTFHELVHSTMKPNRCDRTSEGMEAAFFGSDNYSREELVAEIGSAMCCSCCGIEVAETFKNSVAYIQSWIKRFKNDPKMIVWAASRAEKAAEFIFGANGAI